MFLSAHPLAHHLLESAPSLGTVAVLVFAALALTSLALGRAS